MGEEGADGHSYMGNVSGGDCWVCMGTEKALMRLALSMTHTGLSDRREYRLRCIYLGYFQPRMIRHLLCRSTDQLLLALLSPESPLFRHAAIPITYMSFDLIPNTKPAT
jgi:hypothetical protein